MSCIWNHTGMDSPLQTCLFWSLVALLLQPAGLSKPSGPSDITLANEQQNCMTGLVTKVDKKLNEYQMVSSGKLLRSDLEKNLLNANFPQKNCMVIASMVQTLVIKINSTRFSGLEVSSNLMKSSYIQTRHAMHFPAALMERGPKTAEVRLACIYLKTPWLFKDGKNSSLLNNDILGATLGNFSVINLSQPVEIRFWHNYVLDNSNATCVFWVEGKEDDSLGSWSSIGCETIHQNGMVLCQCNHLTYFAVLLKISSANIDESLLAPLTYITIVGCSISAAASLLTILLYLISRKKSNNYTTKIHMNLLGALFLLNISFLLSEPLASTWLCSSTAAFLHYSFFCCLTWMAIEGFHLYLLLIKVYNVYFRRYVLKLCAVGWGLPAIPVVSILIIKKEVYGQHIIETGNGYRNATMCWVTDGHVHYILNLGYAAITILFNMVILVIVMRMLGALRSKMDSWRKQVKKDIVTVWGLTCLLGTTWALAFFSFSAFLIPQLFLFTIINSLQGFFICLWYCTLHHQPDETSVSNRSSQLTD